MATSSLDVTSGGPSSLARWIALLVPAGLLGGALGSQYIGGLAPCEMCYWQRWPHWAALAFAATSFTAQAGSQRSRLFVILAASAIAVSGAIGVFHAGVEYDWWEGLTRCAASGSALSLDDLMAAPVIQCDQVQWSLMGISLAGYNAIISLGGAGLIGYLLSRRRA